MKEEQDTDRNGAKRMSSLCRVEERDGQFVAELIEPGMTREEICAECPPDPRAGKKFDYNLKGILRRLVKEEFDFVGNNREPGNVRHFWYTNVLWTLMTVVQAENPPGSIISSLAQVWKELVVSRRVSYSGMNIISGKQRNAHSNITNAAFPNLIIGIEKEDYFEAFRWVADLLRCHLITAGGQPSRAVACSLVENLAEQGIDLNQTFTMIVVSDFDPAGMFIKDTFVTQLREAGLGDVQEIWAVLNRDQITDTLADMFAVPCEDRNAKTERAKKGEKTKYQNFAKKTGGGLVISGEPHKIELDSVGLPLIKSKLVETINRIIDAPYALKHADVLDTLDERRDEAKSRLYYHLEESKIDPLAEEYLKPVDDLIETIKDGAEGRKEEIEAQKAEICKEEQEKYDKIQKWINMLGKKQSKLLDIMAEKTELEDERIANIEEETENAVSTLQDFKIEQEGNIFGDAKRELQENVDQAIETLKVDFEHLEKKVQIPERDWSGLLETQFEEESADVSISRKEWPYMFLSQLASYLCDQCEDMVQIPDIVVNSIEDELKKFCFENDVEYE